MKKITFLVMLTIVLSCCKTIPTRQVLDLSLMTNEQPIKAFIVFSQEELNVIVPVQNSSAVSAQFGLVGAVIGSALDASANNSNAQRAEKRLAPIRNNLIDFEFDQNIEDKADVAFSSVDRVKLLPFSKVKNDGLIASRVALGEAFLSISFNYQLTADFRAPTIIARVKMALKGYAPKDDVILYSNNFHYTGSVLNLSPEKFEKQKKLPESLAASYAYMWATSDNQQLNSDLESGVTELLELIVNDLNDLETNESYERRANTSLKYGFKVSHRSFRVLETDKRVVIRSANGRNSGAICSFSEAIKKTEDQYCIY